MTKIKTLSFDSEWKMVETEHEDINKAIIFASENEWCVTHNT